MFFESLEISDNDLLACAIKQKIHYAISSIGTQLSEISLEI